MAHGRNSTIISLRVPDSVYAIVKHDADEMGLNIQDYVKNRLGIMPDGTKRSHHHAKNEVGRRY